MRGIISRIVVAAVLLACAVVAIARTLPPMPLGPDAPGDRFSAVRAARVVEAIAAVPRPTGSRELAAARAAVLAELAALGIEARKRPDGDLVNIVARLAGSATTDAVLLTAHLDSTPDSPGAMDDASGVAAILETVRSLAADGPPRNTVLVLFTDHEEGGMLGARAFIARDPWAADVRVVIGLDAGGVSGPVVLSASSPRSGWLVGQLVASGAPLVGSSAVTTLASSSTDVGRAFIPAGYTGAALDLYWDKGRSDSLADLDLRSLQDQGDHLLSIARVLAASPSLADPRDGDAVYVGVLRAFTVTYPAAWAALIAAVGMAIYTLVVADALRRRLVTPRGLAVGVAAYLGSLGLAAVPGSVLELVVGRWVPELTADWDNRLVDQLPELAVIVACSLVLALATLALAWRRAPRGASGLSIGLGALLPPVLATLVASMVLPGLGFVALPLIGVVGALAAWSRTRRFGPGLLVASAATMIVLVLPTIILGLFSQLVLSMAALAGLVALVVQLWLLVATGPPAPSLTPAAGEVGTISRS